MLPTSTEDVAAAVRYYYGLVPPYPSPSEGGGGEGQGGVKDQGHPHGTRGWQASDVHLAAQCFALLPGTNTASVANQLWCIYNMGDMVFGAQAFTRLATC